MTRPAPGDWRRILLVGFMGAGKTSVGEALAGRLGWRFHDVDRVVEMEVGRPIVEIFREMGEASFRAREAHVAGRLLEEDHVVLSVGGGWGAVPGRLSSVPRGTATVWLEVSPEEAVRRATAEPGQRPLLQVKDPIAEARLLLNQRASGYAGARWRVDTERSSVEDVTARIMDILSAHPMEIRTE